MGSIKSANLRAKRNRPPEGVAVDLASKTATRVRRLAHGADQHATVC
jgi:hypothetical protein